MWFINYTSFLFIILAVFGGGYGDQQKPHIIVIVADDMGFNDVGFHGSDEIPTPNIDALAYNGVILNSHYTQALCTPSRSAFLTGKYPIHLGMQHLVILEPEPWGLPLNETLLPQHLQRNGYRTHAIGKWHLGFFKKEYTPTYRGFDTHFGYWQGLQDYYEHTVHATYTSEKGYDMRRNMTVDWSAQGKYSTHLFTEEAVKLIHEHDTSSPMFMYLAHLAPHTGNAHDPLQAPDEEIAKFAHIADPERRIYAAMVSLLDKSVGKVVMALREKRMLENSIILFMSDNGAQTQGVHANHGSNYPLRGMKNSPWEGAMRCSAAIWSPLIRKPQRVSDQLMHISDWLPTFFSAAGLDLKQLGEIDGKNMWPTISEATETPRKEMVYNIDDIYNYAAVRKGDWKYITGTSTSQNLWYGNSGKNGSYTYDIPSILKSDTAITLAGLLTYKQIAEKTSDNNETVQLLEAETILRLRRNAELKCPSVVNVTESQKCKPLESACVFNIKEDPCERINLAQDRPDVLNNLQKLVEKYRKTAVKPRNIPRDPDADPALHNNTWTNWQDWEEVHKQRISERSLSPLAIGLISAACFAVILAIIILVGVKVKRLPKANRSFSLSDDSVDPATIEMAPKVQMFEDRELQMRSSFKDCEKSVE